MRVPLCATATLCWGLSSPVLAGAQEPVALRIESMLVAPAHTPSLVVAVANLRPAAYAGVIAVEAPEDWLLEPTSQTVELAARETKRVRFQVRKATTVEENRYPMTVVATGAGATVKHAQTVVTASAPYYKPTIDGDPSDWKDAIPVSFTTAGKTTLISTYWNRRQFAILVAVQEDRHGPGDAVQLAIAPQDARTGTAPDQEAARFEFLFRADEQLANARCYRLAEPGTRLSETQTLRKLATLEYPDGVVAVTRRGDITYYECSIPFKPMRSLIRPSEGRELCLSVIVHDPDGTGVRDWGQAAGLWTWQRRRLAWSCWPGARWGPLPPFDNKTPWGLCSSKY